MKAVLLYNASSKNSILFFASASKIQNSEVWGWRGKVWSQLFDFYICSISVSFVFHCSLISVPCQFFPECLFLHVVCCCHLSSDIHNLLASNLIIVLPPGLSDLSPSSAPPRAAILINRLIVSHFLSKDCTVATYGKV